MTAHPTVPRSTPLPVTLPADEARAFLVSHLGLAAPVHPPGAEGVRALLTRLRHIQLDPLDVMGTNADLVALARVEGLSRGDVYRHLYPGHAFEHWAKERCLLPASAFPHYRERLLETPWWRLATRLERVPARVLRAVLEELEAHGPLSAAELTDHGAVQPLDWSGWKGTAKASSMALEVLWTRCEIVVCGRGPGGKRYDVPHRALPQVARASPGYSHERDFERWAVTERVEAAGLLSRGAGAHWSVLAPVRSSPLPETLVREGLLEEVVLPGAPRRYLAPAGFRSRSVTPPLPKWSLMPRMPGRPRHRSSSASAAGRSGLAPQKPIRRPPAPATCPDVQSFSARVRPSGSGRFLRSSAKVYPTESTTAFSTPAESSSARSARPSRTGRLAIGAKAGLTRCWW